jgi:poly-beta-1,6-N-acetyl-D-glucosamine synthase
MAMMIFGTNSADFAAKVAHSPHGKNPFMLNLFLDLILLALIVWTSFETLWWTVVVGRFVLFFSRKKRLKSLSNAEKPAVSVIICARNEAENLRKNLPFILEQIYPKMEVLVVNDASYDETAAVLANFSKKYAHLRVLNISEKNNLGKKTALAAGIRAAKNDWLLMTDADCEPASKFWVAKMAENFSPTKKLVLGYGPYRAESTFLNQWIRLETVRSAIHYFAFAHWGMPFMGVGRNLAYHRSLFESAGGFAGHENLASGDDDLFVTDAATISNTAICLDPSAFVFSEAKKTWASYQTQKSRHFTTGRHYGWFQKGMLGFAALSPALHFFLILVLLLTGHSMVVVIICYILRISILWSIWAIALRRLGEKNLEPIIPVFDVLIILFHGLFSPIIFFSNNQSRSWT